MHALADVVRHIIVRVYEANPRVAHKLRAFGLMDKLRRQDASVTVPDVLAEATDARFTADLAAS